MDCNSGGASPYGIERLQALAAAEGGIYADIESLNAEADCEYFDPAGFWADWIAVMAD